MNWLASHKRFAIVLLALVVLQTLFIFWMISDRRAVLESGDVITLKAEPVDPRDLFRGDYVTLSYAISRINFDGLPGDKDFDSGDNIYVEITQARDTWLVQSAWHKYPVPAKDNKVIRGKIASLIKGTPRVRPIPGGNEMEEMPCESCATANISYGIENYFVPEGKGRELEKSRNARNLSVDVALSSHGEAAIKALRIDGIAIQN